MRVAERAGGCGPTARVPCVAAAAAAAATALAGARRSRGAQRQGSRQMGPRIRIRVEVRGIVGQITCRRRAPGQ